MQLPIAEKIERQTVVEPAEPRAMQEEIDRLDAIDAIQSDVRKEEYWRTLHPLVQAYWLRQVDWKFENELPIRLSDASSVFHYWGYPADIYSHVKTDLLEEWMQRYDSCKEALWQQSEEAKQIFKQIDEETQQAKKQAWDTYAEHYQTLPRQLQSLVGWELAKRHVFQGRSGWQEQMPYLKLPSPFVFCGWASYQDPSWGYCEGVAFCITKDCFGDRTPTLYYFDDDNWPNGWKEQEALETISRYSSGISNARVEMRRCKNWRGVEDDRRVVLFDLDPSAVKETVLLSGEAVSTQEVGEYIFVLPRSGEFDCVLGEVRGGELISLCNADFCMK